jgi:hypothetical protein
MSNLRASTQFSRRWIATLGLLAGCVLAPGLASAQPCADIENIPGDLYGFWGDQFESFFPIGDEDICGALAKKFESSCEKSVKDAVKCWNKRLDELVGGAKYPCKTEGNDAPDCKESYKAYANDGRSEIEGTALDATAACQDAAEGLFDFCMFP